MHIYLALSGNKMEEKLYYFFLYSTVVLCDAEYSLRALLFQVVWRDETNLHHFFCLVFSMNKQNETKSLFVLEHKMNKMLDFMCAILCRINGNGKCRCRTEQRATTVEMEENLRIRQTLEMLMLRNRYAVCYLWQLVSFL